LRLSKDDWHIGSEVYFGPAKLPKIPARNGRIPQQNTDESAAIAALSAPQGGGYIIAQIRVWMVE